MELSLFGEKFSSESGIRELMDDLSKALSGGTKQFMLGGGILPIFQKSAVCGKGA